MKEIQRFTKFIQLDIISGCWNWKATINNAGYGFFTVKRKIVLAHRYSYEYYNGKIPKGLVINHLCRNTECVNPQHLEVVTQRENILKGTLQKNSKTHCINGHEFTLENSYTYPKGKYRCCRICAKIKQEKWLSKQL